MSESDRARRNATPGPSILHRDVARKSSSFGSSKVAFKAARKTFAEPDSSDDSDPTRRPGQHALLNASSPLRSHRQQ